MDNLILIQGKQSRDLSVRSLMFDLGSDIARRPWLILDEVLGICTGFQENYGC